MATYQIWADITSTGQGGYLITVSAVPAEERTELRTGGVKTAVASTFEEAEEVRDEMVLQLGKKLRGRGHVIVNRFDDVK